LNVWDEDRHEADYNPRFEIPLLKPDAQTMIGAVQAAISGFEGVDEKHRRAFSIMVASKRRKGT